MDIRETLNSGRVADMPQYMVLERSLQFIGRLVETLYLKFGEIIKIRAVAAHKM
jgi:hypothetical protein